MSAGTGIAFPDVEVPDRLSRLVTSLADAAVDALVVTRLVNVRYLTGFTGSAATLVVGPEGAHLATDGRYRDQVHDQLAACGVDIPVTIGTVTEQRAALARATRGGRRVGLEAQGVTWAEQRQWVDVLDGAEVVPVEHLVEALRRVKDAGEVARVRAACAIADEAFAEVAPMLGEGPTEREFALELEVAMRRRGAAGVSFPPIVASGPHAAMPHARPDDRIIGRGELVVLDFGCVVDGYCSDMTRTVSVGDPGPDAVHLYQVVHEAQAAGRAQVRPGVACADVDARCREIIVAAGLGDAFVHSTGHGVGLEIHEDPRLAATSGGTVLAGDVVTVEPGVYLRGVGGVRIEDTVVVTATGAEVLTATPKELVL